MTLGVTGHRAEDGHVPTLSGLRYERLSRLAPERSGQIFNGPSLPR